MEGVSEYQKRFPREWRFEWLEIPLATRAKTQSVAKVIAEEGEAVLKHIDAKEWVVALDVQGKPWSTEVLAHQVAQWQLDGVNISILIGGPNGLFSGCLKRANQRWSLSSLTLPHPLVRVLLTEQLYRAWSILQNHPYHK